MNRAARGNQAPVAQWIERSPSKRNVAGSIPAWGTKLKSMQAIEENSSCRVDNHIMFMNEDHRGALRAAIKGRTK